MNFFKFIVSSLSSMLFCYNFSNIQAMENKSKSNNLSYKFIVYDSNLDSHSIFEHYFFNDDFFDDIFFMENKLKKETFRNNNNFENKVIVKYVFITEKNSLENKKSKSHNIISNKSCNSFNFKRNKHNESEIISKIRSKAYRATFNKDGKTFQCPICLEEKKPILGSSYCDKCCRLFCKDCCQAMSKCPFRCQDSRFVDGYSIT